MENTQKIRKLKVYNQSRNGYSNIPTILLEYRSTFYDRK